MYFSIHYVKCNAEENEDEVGTCKAMSQSDDDFDDSDVEMMLISLVDRTV